MLPDGIALLECTCLKNAEKITVFDQTNQLTMMCHFNGRLILDGRRAKKTDPEKVSPILRQEDQFWLKAKLPCICLNTFFTRTLQFHACFVTLLSSRCVLRVKNDYFTLLKLGFESTFRVEVIVILIDVYSVRAFSHSASPSSLRNDV